jgi:hypothetical protein
MSPEENFNPDDRSVESHQYKDHTILILNPEKSHREQSYIILGPNGDVVDQWWDNLTVGISYLDAAKEHVNFYEPPSTDKVTVDRDVVQRLIDSTLEHDAPLRHVQDAADYIIARRQIGNPLVRAGEQLPRYMYDGRFEPGHQYDLYTKETRNLMYRLTQVLEKGERAQSDIYEEDLMSIEEEDWRAETAATIESLEEKYDFIETAVTEYDGDGITHVEILPDRFIKQARLSVDDEQFHPEIVAEIREQPPVIVDEEIRFYRNDQAGQHVGELVVPDSIQPLLRSYLDQLEDVLEEAIGGFEINSQAIEL